LEINAEGRLFLAVTVVYGWHVAGILNVMTGGGSLITLPFLIFMGLPGVVANGTNRIAILCQNIFALRDFHKRRDLSVKLALLCTPPALLGSCSVPIWQSRGRINV